jgi:hypothetical protein
MSSVGFLLAVLCWLAAVGLLRRFVRRWTGLWADVLAAGLLWLLVTGFFWRTLTRDVYQPADGGDLASFLFPTYRFAAATLAQGLLPLWNPTLYGGTPLSATSSLVFSTHTTCCSFGGPPIFRIRHCRGSESPICFGLGWACICSCAPSAGRRNRSAGLLRFLRRWSLPWRTLCWCIWAISI